MEVLCRERKVLKYIYIYIYISVGHERKKRIMRVFLQFVKLRKNYKLRGGMRDFVSVNT